MDGLIILFVIIAVINGLANSAKKKAAAQKRAQGQGEAQQGAPQGQYRQQGAPQGQYQRQGQYNGQTRPQGQRPARQAPQQAPRKPRDPWTDVFPDVSAPSPAKPQPQAYGSMPYVSDEGAGSATSMNYASSEGTGNATSMPYTSREGAGADVGNATRHVVRPLTETAHAHMETSMTGAMPASECEEDVRNNQSVLNAEAAHNAAYNLAGEAMARTPVLSFDTNSVLKGELYAEILGKPKSMRNRA